MKKYILDLVVLFLSLSLLATGVFMFMTGSTDQGLQSPVISISHPTLFTIAGLLILLGRVLYYLPSPIQNMVFDKFRARLELIGNPDKPAKKVMKFDDNNSPDGAA